jgi:hypothetical protein
LVIIYIHKDCQATCACGGCNKNTVEADSAYLFLQSFQNNYDIGTKKKKGN